MINTLLAVSLQCQADKLWERVKKKNQLGDIVRFNNKFSELTVIIKQCIADSKQN